MGVFSKDFLFLRHRKSDVELAAAKVPDGGFVTGFLCPEVIAGDAQHDKASGPVFFPQRLQLGVLRGKPTFGRRIDQ